MKPTTPMPYSVSDQWNGIEIWDYFLQGHFAQTKKNALCAWEQIANCGQYICVYLQLRKKLIGKNGFQILSKFVQNKQLTMVWNKPELGLPSRDKTEKYTIAGLANLELWQHLVMKLRKWWQVRENKSLFQNVSELKYKMWVNNYHCNGPMILHTNKYHDLSRDHDLTLLSI